MEPWRWLHARLGRRAFLFCHTEAHNTAVRKHVINQLFRVKQDPAESTLFDPVLVTLMETLVPAATTPDKKAKGKAKTTPDKTELDTEGGGKKIKAGLQSGKKKKGGKRQKGMDGNQAKSESDDQSGGDADDDWSADDAD